MKKQKGITLISLIVTISILGILASVATYSGINVIKMSKLTAFTAELKIMQTQVNTIYQEKDEDTVYGEEITGDIKKQADIVFNINESGIVSQEGYRYWSNAMIKDLGIEGVEQSFFVNLQTRSVVSYQGLKQDEKAYYTLEQLPDGLYNVEYRNSNTGKPTFDVNVEDVGANKWKITISNIEYSGYIKKWQVKYRLKDKNYWNTTEDTSFVITEQGDYEVYIQNDNVVSETKLVETDAKVGKIVTDFNKEYTNNGKAIVPVGFMIVPGLDDVSEGLVISDDREDSELDPNNKIVNGNQFVWIPVTDEKDYKRNVDYVDKNVSTTSYTTDEDYLPKEIQEEIQEELDNAKATDTKTLGQVMGEINEQKEREVVVTKGGFYISRYEAGVLENSKLISKKGAVVKTLLSFQKAKDNAKTFIDNAYVKSAIISGIQWDMTMQFITRDPLRKDGLGNDYDVTKTDDNRQKQTSAPDVAGNNEADKVCNVYDLEGNCLEYIAEKNTAYDPNYPNNVRGGSFGANAGPASKRAHHINGGFADLSFRFVLYVM